MQQAVVEQALLNVAKQVEQQIDAELHKLENLQDDDIEALRQRRIQELRRQQEKSREWLAKGHGEYREIPGEKEFFAEMKGEERMICHFYRENWPCKVRATRDSDGNGARRFDSAWSPDHGPFLLQVMDKHLAILAKKHIETKFVKVAPPSSPPPCLSTRAAALARAP